MTPLQDFWRWKGGWAFARWWALCRDFTVYAFLKSKLLLSICNELHGALAEYINVRASWDLAFVCCDFRWFCSCSFWHSLPRRMHNSQATRRATKSCNAYGWETSLIGAELCLAESSLSTFALETENLPGQPIWLSFLCTGNVAP